jgi:RNA polymerase sigma-70 factor (ECF subfamily)
LAKEQDDGSLVAQCRGGDPTSFDELVRRYKDRVYTVVYRYLGHREDALDVSQEVFVRAYRGIDEFRGTASFSTWLFSIASNLSRNRLRDSSRRGRDKALPLEAATASGKRAETSPRSDAERHELDSALQRCLCDLPEMCRMAFVLRVQEGMSYQEIAEAMQCPEGTVKSRISQARSLLRERLREMEMI